MILLVYVCLSVCLSVRACLSACVCVCMSACVHVCVHECVSITVITQGTQKSIDKARELIDEVLSRPDKEYEAAKHQLTHSSGHFQQQQNRSYEV